MGPHQLIHKSSGNIEYGTPRRILEAARAVMVGIDLDPASSETFNKNVKAARWFDSGGLEKDWLTADGQASRVWMNHPFGRKANPAWIKKLIGEYENGNVKEACCLTYADESTQWGTLLRGYWRWKPDSRIAFLDADGRTANSPTKGVMVTYFGKRQRKFAMVFVHRLKGSVDVPYRWIEW